MLVSTASYVIDAQSGITPTGSTTGALGISGTTPPRFLNFEDCHFAFYELPRRRDEEGADGLVTPFMIGSEHIVGDGSDLTLRSSVTIYCFPPCLCGLQDSTHSDGVGEYIYSLSRRAALRLSLGYPFHSGCAPVPYISPILHLSPHSPFLHRCV